MASFFNRSWHLNDVERLTGGYATECPRVRQDLANRRGPASRLPGTGHGEPFTYESYLAQLPALRDQLKAVLSGGTPEPGGDKPLAASELAEQIKAVKAAHTIEAAPERVGRRGFLR